MTHNDDPWASRRYSSTPTPHEIPDDDYGDHEYYTTEELAGPFCPCGDFACPGGEQPSRCPER